MANLPSLRISQIKPFSRSAVDFGRPFDLIINRDRSGCTCKAYLCIIVCFATETVHFELATDLLTYSFLAALQDTKKLCDLYSDCGRNFLGASRELLWLSCMA